jgi:hypothetical protein
MSASELQQVESLVFRALPDPRGFANRVLEQILDRLVTESPIAQPVTVVQVPAQDRTDRIILLAAALGACECWGDDLDCGVCGGAGSSGWTDPDQDLYREYVRPAAHKAGMASTSFTNSQPNGTARQD